MNRRAEKLAAQVHWKSLAPTGPILDLGCGTGHNAVEIHKQTHCEVSECDVVNYHMLDREVCIFDGRALPFPDHHFDACSLFYSLHYAEDPADLLTEIRRVTANHLVVAQSTYAHAFGKRMLHIREYVLGRLPFLVLRRLKVIPNAPCGMTTFRHLTGTELRRLFTDTGWKIERSSITTWRGLGVHRELFILTKASPA
jgi:SAM-dependent methyltransferase